MNGKRVSKRTPIAAVIRISLFALLALLILVFVGFHLLKEDLQHTDDLPNTPEIESPATPDDSVSSDEVTQVPDDTLDKPNEEDHMAHYTRKEECFTFLLTARDKVSGNADVIMVCMYDMVQQTVGIISVPRDTLIDPSCAVSKFPKINSTYLYGIERLKESVSNLLGVPIDYYVTVDISAFVTLVDTLGGIDFDVPVHMSYDDPYQDLYIHFEPGMQHLTGEEALAVCRLRYNQDGTVAYPDYDIGRTRTQQAMLITLAKKALSKPQKLDDYIRILTENITTDLSFGNILSLAESAVLLDFENNISSATLSGDGEVTCRGVTYCYQLDADDTLQLVNDLINPYIEPRVLNDLDIFSVE